MTTTEVLLTLVRAGLGKEHAAALPDDVAWDEVLLLADRQGVAPVAADGLKAVDATLVKKTKIQWARRILDCEKAYRHHERVIASLALFYIKRRIRMMVIKGWGLSLEYPIPSHRPSGDLDVWLFGKWREADEAVASHGATVSSDHHHHTEFDCEGVTVENHYDFINVHARRSSRRYEQRLKELAEKPANKTPVLGSYVYLPTPDFNMLFLLRHASSHFVGKGMSLRQVIDWALYVERHHEEFDWEGDLRFLRREGLDRFFRVMALVSIEKLGFSREAFHCPIPSDPLAERVFADIIHPEFDEEPDGGSLSVMWTKTRRWWSNRWKQRLCYPDSLASAFAHGLWAKVLKPRQFID